MMNLRQIEAFYMVAKNNSFSKAARELHLTQPTISTNITNLEKELGTPLFIRSTTSVALTENGEKLYIQAKRIVDATKMIDRIFDRKREREMRMEIVIAASTVPAQYLIPQILLEASKQDKSLQFRLIECDSEEVANKVGNQLVDIGFAGSVIENRYCKYLPFYDDELIVVAPNNPYYQEIQREHRDIRWIEGERIILREAGSGTRKEAMRVMKRLGIAEENLNIVAIISNPLTLLQSIAGGMGITVISKLAAQKYIEDGTLLGFSLGEGGAHRAISLVYNSKDNMSESAQQIQRAIERLYP